MTLHRYTRTLRACRSSDFSLVIVALLRFCSAFFSSYIRVLIAKVFAADAESSRMIYDFQKSLLGLLLILLTGGQAAHAEEAHWVSSTHLGFATVRRSTTGFESVSGSLVFLDTVRPFGDRIEIGLRTIAQGGEGSKSSYYRLGAGPLVSLKLEPHWRVHLAIATFDEAVLDTAGSKLYRSRGRTAVIGWERSLRVAPRLEFSWGGFATLHEGDIKPTEGLSAAVNPFKKGQQNAGMSQGVEAALRFSL